MPCSDGYEHTAPVGSFQPNDFGLYDVLGNVWEWTASCHQYGYMRRPDCDIRVVRGGGHNSERRWLRSAMRTARVPEFKQSELGFRVARTVN